MSSAPCVDCGFQTTRNSSTISGNSLSDAKSVGFVSDKRMSRGMGQASDMRGVLCEDVEVTIGEKGGGRVWLWRDMYGIIMLEREGNLHVSN